MLPEETTLDMLQHLHHTEGIYGKRIGHTHKHKTRTNIYHTFNFSIGWLLPPVPQIGPRKTVNNSKRNRSAKLMQRRSLAPRPSLNGWPRVLAPTPQRLQVLGQPPPGDTHRVTGFNEWNRM